MILAIDVDYGEDAAHAAGVVFKNWQDEEPIAVYTAHIQPIHEYIPGQFYKRELPCIMEILDQVKEAVSCIVVDGYVYLGQEEKAGLGKYLFDALEGKVPVIGVAKSSFVDTPDNCAVLRGQSANPLFVTAVGIDQDTAKSNIGKMHGEYRFPTLLKLVDKSCREWPAEKT